MRIAFVDDDKLALAQLQSYLAASLGSAEMETFPSGEAFLARWQPGMYDLIVLEIFMGELTGMAVARKIRETDADVWLVFGTSSNEFASESYEVNACYYLRKPFRPEQVAAMLGRLDLPELERSRALTLPDGQRIRLREVVYADYAGHQATLHLKDGGAVVCRTSFAELEPLLCAYPYFCSPSRGVLVNFHEVTAHDGGTFVMRGGVRLPVSRRKAREVAEAYSAFRFSQLRKGGVC